MKSCIFVLVLGALCAAEIVHKTKTGETKMLNCGISGASKWLRGNNLLLSEDPRTGMPLKGKGEIVQRSRLKQGRNLEISRITPQDAGLFSCSGNGQEEQHRLVVFSMSVSPPGRLEVGSEATLQCEVSAGLPQGAAAEWVRPGGGQRQGTSRLQLTSVALEDAGAWVCVFSAGGETLSENVTLQVTGPRTTATPSTTTTTEHANNATCLNCDGIPTHGPQQEGLLGLSWWVWAAVGGGCLVLLLWVLILVMYNRMMRRKRRFLKMRKADLLKPKQYCRCPGGPTAAAGQKGKKPSAPIPAPVYATP